jgi:AAA domain
VPDFFEALAAKEAAEKAQREASRRPTTATNAVAAIYDPTHATRYTQAALDGELANVRSATEGRRNDTLNEAAFNLGTFIASGDLERDHVTSELALAAYATGLTEPEVGKTIASGINGSSDKPRTIPKNGSEISPNLTVVSVNGQDGDQQLTAEQAIELHRQRLVVRELESQRARREASRILDAEEALKSFREPPSRFTLTEELAIVDPPVIYTIDRLLPAGGNVLLTAQYKTGKTTLVNNLARALADQSPFLGMFDVAGTDGRVALWNYELSDRQYRQWLREAGIQKTGNVTVLNLRGYRMPVNVPNVENWIIRWLTEREVRIWVVDPFARAFTGSGTSENDNTEVGRFLDTLDVIKNRAGVTDLILPTHTGRAEFEQGEERARGATRLDDWADVRWILTKDEEDVRYFRATGRDVEVAEEKLTYHDTTRSLVFGGGDRRWEKRRRLEDSILQAVKDDPGTTQAAIVRAVGANRDNVISALAGLERVHKIRIEHGGKGLGDRHYSTEIAPFGGVQDEL